MAYEEAPYNVVHSTETYEIRHYKDRLIVEVKMQPPLDSNLSNYKPLQTISTVDIINKELRFSELKFRNLPIIISDNSVELAVDLADQCKVPFNAINLSSNTVKLLFPEDYQNRDLKHPSLEHDYRSIISFVKHFRN